MTRPINNAPPGTVVQAIEPTPGWYQEPNLTTGRRYVVVDSDGDMMRLRPVEGGHAFWCGNNFLQEPT